MSSLPAALIVYGGYSFNAETLTTRLHVDPKYDEAERTVTHTVYSITLETILAGRTIDAAVRNVVRELNKPAQRFIYSGTGLGVAVNIAGLRDVMWGPKPRGVEVKPLGGGNAVKLTWTVEFAIPDCSDAIYAFAPMEYNFGLTFDLDDGGYTRRTFSGFLRIPMTRLVPAARTIPDSADYYRERIVPPLVPGFRRESSRFTISNDKGRLDFAIVDRQMGYNAPPPGCVHAKLDHSYSNPPGKLRTWNNTLTGEYEIAMSAMAGGRGFVAARDAFFRALKDRISTVAAYFNVKNFPSAPNPNVNGQPPAAQLDNRQSAVIVPQAFSVQEPDAYGKPVARFSCTYMVANARLADMLVASGVFQPLPDSNWQVWQASLGNTFGPRGHAELVFHPGEDAIVDLCGPSQIPLLRTLPFRSLTGGYFIPPGIFPDPTPNSSWILWENNFRMEADNGTVPLLTMAANTLARTGTGLPLVGGLLGDFLQSPPANGPNVPPPTGIPWKLPNTDKFFTPIPNPITTALFGGGSQQRKQSAFLYMYGRAIRVGYAISPPVLYRWGKVVVTPANRRDSGEGFVAGPIGDVGVTVWGARWCLRYFVPELPAGVELPVSQPPMSKA